MATDVEESDTDDHERPAPPKRQCTRLVGTDETDERSAESNEPDKLAEEEKDAEDEEMERLASAQLRLWQECHVNKGFMENTINRIVEKYIVNAPSNNSFFNATANGVSQFRGDEMEDTAVTMAISNRGLVHTTSDMSIPPDVCSSIDENSAQSRAPLPENLPSSSTVSPSTLDNSHRDHLGRLRQVCLQDNEATSSSNDDEMDESDRDQLTEFLDRAIAEAIKKKGLSVQGSF